MTVVMSYMGPFLSEYREEMVNKKWLAEVRSHECKVCFTFFKLQIQNMEYTVNRLLFAISSFLRYLRECLYREYETL